MYDDNFGMWDMRGEETMAFYRYVQKHSVEKECADCGDIVRIMPDYAICNNCASARENGSWHY